MLTNLATGARYSPHMFKPSYLSKVHTVQIYDYFHAIIPIDTCASAQWVSPALVATLQLLANDALVNRHPDQIWRPHHFSRRQFQKLLSKRQILYDVRACDEA